MPNPNDMLRHHVTGAIERGEKTAIVEIPVHNCVPTDSGEDAENGATIYVCEICGKTELGEPDEETAAAIAVRNLLDRPDSATHFECPAEPGKTHHLRRVKGELACSYCDKTDAEIRREAGL